MGKYCGYCGTALKENANFCGNCGRPVKSIPQDMQKPTSVSEMNASTCANKSEGKESNTKSFIQNIKAFVSGWIIALCGVVLEIYTAQTIRADKEPKLFADYYTYEPPLTSHESLMITLGIIAAFLIIAGIVVVIASQTRKKGNNRCKISAYEQPFSILRNTDI